MALTGYDNADVFDRLLRTREGALADAKGSARPAEFDIFASGRGEIGENHPRARLHARTLARDEWTDETVGVDLSAITNLVAVHRLREVSCLYGFTRFEAAPGVADDEMEDVQLAVRGAPLSRCAEWLPAIEQLGEGLFIHFDPPAIRGWLAKHGKACGGAAGRYDHWRKLFGDHPPPWRGAPYILLHSLAHALMAQIAVDCGYPAGSLKERIYAEPSGPDRDDFGRCGILIYTATAGARGTLGGLVGTAPRFATVLAGALESLSICSNDPICADHTPDEMSGDRATHGAACHGCLLISETSCEMRNQSLDRALIVETMAQDGAAFFYAP